MEAQPTDGKRCTTCGERKPLDDFAPDRRNKSGRQARCRVCAARILREKRVGDPEWATRDRERRRGKYATDPEHAPRLREQARQWRAADPDRVIKHRADARERARRLREARCSRFLARVRTVQAVRRARKRNATPPDADPRVIAEFYREAAMLTEQHDIAFVVDHMWPLAAGGLHHQDNLRVITAQANMAKGARITLTREEIADGTFEDPGFRYPVLPPSAEDITAAFDAAI